jgi:nucleoside-diphosphate-sugar epimerase
VSIAGRLVAVTGATGFLGRRLGQALLAAGCRVRALARRQTDVNTLEALGMEVVLGDLADHAALIPLAADGAAVVHCAGLIKARGLPEFLEVNRDGARAVAEVSGGRLILVSSLAAREPGLSPYAASKRAGEAAMLAAAGNRVTILRPPAIYGPGDRETLALFELAARSPILPLLGGPSARLALAHVDDVTATILYLLEADVGPGPFAVGGARPEGYSWREMLSEAAGAMGRRPAMVWVPAWFLKGAGWASEALGAARGAPSIFSSGKARELLHDDWSVRTSELAPGAPTARFDLEAGFTDAVAWYRRAGWLAA